MAFYWWSHWFWITCLSVQLLPTNGKHVRTYPIQALTLEATTHRDIQAGRTDVTGHAINDRQTTKLYQTTSQTWFSTSKRNIMDLTLRTTVSTMVMPKHTGEKLQKNAENDSVDSDDNGDRIRVDVNKNTDKVIVKQAMSHNQFEFKRSADFAAVSEGVAISPGEQLNNYTNFSSSTSTNPNSTTSSSNITATFNKSSLVVSTSTKASLTMTSTTISPPPNSTRQTDLATPSTPKINTEWLTDGMQKAPFTLENVNKEDELRRTESDHRTRKSKVLSAEYLNINFSSDSKSLLARSASVATSVSSYDPDKGNISSEALAIQRTYFLDAGAISAICFTVFGICCTVGTIGIVLYRRRYLNKPQALSEPDSSVYIDDSTIRDNSDEMYSLDNDSFLNSLEAMTIQNYWTDTVKHTKL